MQGRFESAEDITALRSGVVSRINPLESAADFGGRFKGPQNCQKISY